MLGRWRLTLRKAEHALQAGRLDEAGAYVTRPDVRSYRQARELADRVAAALVGRAEEHLKHGDSQRAWADLEQAERLGGDERIGQVRGDLVRRSLDEARDYLQAGQPSAALACLNHLAGRGLTGVDYRRLHEAATAWQTGLNHARAGHFAQAREQYERVRALLPDCPAVEPCLEEAFVSGERLKVLEEGLYQALAEAAWDRVLHQADAILALAPDHVRARAARDRAWQVVGAPASIVRGGRPIMDKDNAANLGDAKTVIRAAGGLGSDPLSLPGERGRGEGEQGQSEGAGFVAGREGQRFLLWIDAVGGYLVCLGERVSIGQPAGWHVDVPVMADLSRLHAWIERDGEGYLLRAVRPATVDGRPVKEHGVLADNAQILLGQNTRLRFRRPTPLSRSARLDIESPHRLALPAEAVLLMAETCIIGPKPSSHVVAPDWGREVVLYRQGDELWVRTAGAFEVDGQPCQERGRLTLSSRIRGEAFSLALEPLAS